MATRRAIIVADAAGPPEAAADVLSRFGFATIIPAARLDQALARLRAEPFDLLVIPLRDVDAWQLATLERELHTRPTLSVIGTAPAADPDLILRAMRAGVREFLVHPPGPKELGDAVERLVSREGQVTPNGQVIAVYSAKGGLGTTSVAVNTALALAAESRTPSVALADCVFTGGDVRVFLNLSPSYDISDLVSKLAEADAALLRSLLTPGPFGVSVLPSSEDPLFDDAFDAATANAVIDRLRTSFDVTVVDCEHHLSERALAILDAADRIVLLTQPNVPSLRSTQRTLALFRRLGYADTKACIVLNRFQAGDIFSVATVNESLKHEVFWTLPNDYRTSIASLNRGISVTQQDASSKLARSYAQLASALRTRSEAAGNGAGHSNGAGSRSRLRGIFSKAGK